MGPNDLPNLSTVNPSMPASAPGVSPIGQMPSPPVTIPDSFAALTTPGAMIAIPFVDAPVASSPEPQRQPIDAQPEFPAGVFEFPATEHKPLVERRSTANRNSIRTSRAPTFRSSKSACTAASGWSGSTTPRPRKSRAW
jgi:hypothetical protein